LAIGLIVQTVRKDWELHRGPEGDWAYANRI
jgi:hypothetical protein